MPPNDPNNTGYGFLSWIESRPVHKDRYYIFVYFIDGKVSRIYYTGGGDHPFKLYVEEAEFLPHYCTPEVVWTKPTTNKEETEMTWTGSGLPGRPGSRL